MADSTLHQKVAEAFRTQLAPLMLASGLELELGDVESDGVVIMHLAQACQFCPSTAMAMIREIEVELIKLVPEVAYIEITAKR